MKRIEMDWEAGSVYTIFIKAVSLAVQHQCDDVVFEFNEGMFSVNRNSVWDETTNKKLQSFPRQDYEVKL